MFGRGKCPLFPFLTIQNKGKERLPKTRETSNAPHDLPKSVPSIAKTNSSFNDNPAMISFTKGKNNKSQSVYLLFKKRFTFVVRLAKSVSSGKTEPNVFK